MIVVYLHDTQERMLLLASHPGDDAQARHWAESRAHRLLDGSHGEPDSEARVVTAQVLERIEVGDFVMRGPTP